MRTTCFWMLMSIVSILHFAQSAHAYDCDSVVVDGAGLFGRDHTKVEEAANKLIKAGANVRVHTLKNFGSLGSLDHYKAEIQEACASWRSADGGMRNNLVVFMIEMDHREVGLYFGDQWRQTLNDNIAAKIRSDRMAPRFRDGDFAGGFASGVAYVADLVSSETHPVPRNGPTTIIQQEATDYSGLVKLLKWFFILGVLAIIVIVAIRYLQTRRKEIERREEAGRRMDAAKTACATAITNFNRYIPLLKSKIENVRPMVSEKDVVDFLTAFSVLNQKHETASVAFSALETVEGSDPSDKKATSQTFDRLTSKYEEIASSFLKTAEGVKSDLERNIAQAVETAKQAPQRIAEATTKIRSAKEILAGVQGKGFKTGTTETLIAEAERFTEEANTFLEAKKPGDAARMAANAASRAACASNDAQALEQKKGDLDRACASQSQALEEAKKRASGAFNVFKELSEKYAESSWTHIQGNGTEAENRLYTALEKLEEATKAVSMEVQDWNGASRLLREAGALTEEAGLLINTIFALNRSLIEAENRAQREIDAANADIQKAWAYIKAHDNDVADALEADLKEVQATLAQARTELAREKPNFIEVVRTALKANQDADHILECAEDQHERAVRKRKQAKDLVTEADRSIEEASRYIQVHDRDVGRSAVALLEQARSPLALARRSSNTDEQISYAARADELADKALKEAKSNFTNAENARRRRREEEEEEEERRRRRRASSSSMSFPSTYPSSNTSWGSPSPSRSSGGSSSWGSSGSGFGGSSSFGGSSRGGGGSSKW